jgi:hypothetical protein
MRTTLSIDDDILVATKSLAHARSESLGRVISDLVRRSINATPRVGKRREKGKRFPVFRVSPDAHPISIEDVRKFEDEE